MTIGLFIGGLIGLCIIAGMIAWINEELVEPDILWLFWPFATLWVALLVLHAT